MDGLDITVKAWADIVIQNWIDKIYKMQVLNTHTLVRELAQDFALHIVSNSNGNPEFVEFAFRYYGRFVDMNVGRGAAFGSNTKRKKKGWYSATFYAELNQLSKILAEKYAFKGSFIISSGWSNPINMVSLDVL
jgi:hypothetical protein